MPNYSHKLFAIRIVVLLLLLLLNSTAQGGKLEKVVAAAVASMCPKFCECDVYEERNRADCSGKRLISASAEISPMVEILDLSYNDITQLDNGCLKSYRVLINLTLAHNAIQNIELDAFTRLRRLRSIDLSYNRLEYLDERLFEMNHKLLSLNLEGNRFMLLQNRPLLRSISMRSLNLRNSQISHIDDQLLTALPHLQDLDISQNLLITISATAFNALRSLHRVEMSENHWTCDAKLGRVVELMRRRGVELKLTDCNFDRKAIDSDDEDMMFERLEMVNVEDSPEAKTESNQDSDDPSWKEPPYDDIYNDDDFDEHGSGHRRARPNASLEEDREVCESTMSEDMCRGYRKCLDKVGYLLISRVPDSGQQANSTGFTQNDMIFTFLLGVAAGLTIATTIVTAALCHRTCSQARKMRSDYQGAIINEELRVLDDMQSPSVEYQPSAPSQLPHAPQAPRPMPCGRIRRHRRGPPAADANQNLFSRAIVRSYQGPDNFITRLFGRPARHQYYRSINRNTATLIRRLSRSNLFTNRANDDRPASELRPSTSHEDNGPRAENASRTFENRTDSRDFKRSETPPPDYGDIVVNPN